MENILIIDDSPLQQKLAAIYLSRENYNIIVANGGKEGIEKAAKEQPGLIILDIEMPDMDGLETLKLLKHNPLTSSIDVLMCSSVKKDEVIKEAIGLGAKGYLNKPHGFKNFKDQVKNILSGTA